MKLSTERVGEASILAEAMLWSLFPIVTILSFSSVSPLVSLGLSTFFATLFFAVLLTMRRSWRDVVNVRALPDMLLATLVLGILYYVLIFFGLQYTSAGNASILLLSDIFFG